MSVISYQRPEIQSDNQKAVPYEGKSFPYNMIADDRRFEELVYSIYRARIEAKTLTGFGDISLMTGVRDEGRDCVLYNNGKITGLIQCKKIEKSLSIEIVGKEITKFVLYSILHPELIGDHDDFEYIIAVSKGFANDCHKFIDDFSARIATEPKLANWINELLKQPTLLPLQSTIRQDDVLNILTKLKVTKIQPPDLDRWLMEPGVKHIIPLFFQIRTVTDSSLIEQVDEKLDKFLSRDLDAREIQKQLERSSASLRVQSNELDQVADSHIVRNETQVLFDWVVTPAQKDDLGRDKNICLLSGDAGIGKTVILKDFYDLLSESGIPVLALKADKLYPANMVDLQQKVSLSLPIPDFIDQCRQRFDTTVILIDQIDALSQSMSSDRNFLHVFRTLIDQLMYDNNIRVVISVRTFDLNYDPTLKIYKNIKAVKVGLLSEEDVYRQLNKIQVPKSAVNAKLLSLLRTPNHLNIYSTIINGTQQRASAINNLQELYLELWMQKIIRPVIATFDSQLLKDLLYRIAERMFIEQRIALNQYDFETDQKELAYLESERIIRIQDQQLQFFHQSFYDFVFAKRFVENGHDIKEYILAQKQTLLIRSAVKMILNYLRTYDPARYIRELAVLLRSQRVLFHIKHLVISLLAAQDEPGDAEKTVFEQEIIPKKDYQVVLFEHAYGNGWSDLVFRSGLLDHLIKPVQVKSPSVILRYWYKIAAKDASEEKAHRQHFRHICSRYLRNQLAQNTEVAFDLALKIEDLHLIRWLIVTLDRWDNEKAYQLLDRLPELLHKQDRDFFNVMESILEFNPAFVLKHVENVILVDTYFDQKRKNDLYHEKKFLKILADKLPAQLLDPLLANLEAVMNDQRYSEMGFNGDFKYKDVQLGDELDEEFSDGHELLYKMLGLSLRYVAVHDPERFQSVSQRFSMQTDDSYLRLLIFAFSGNLKRYAAHALTLFKHLIDNELLYHDDKLSHDYRVLLENSFAYFTKKEQQTVVQLIRDLRVPKELYIYQREDIKKTFHIRWGLTKYYMLKRLPESIIKNDSALRREYLALDRKFNTYSDRPRSNRGIARVVGRPLSPEAYKKMRAKNWIRSFRKYDNDQMNWDSYKGGLREHSWAFNEFAKNDPEETIVVLTEIASDPEIRPDYKIYGVYGLTNSEIDARRILPFVKLFLNDQSYKVNPSIFISAINHLFTHELYDDELIDFIIEQACEHDEPTHWQKEMEEKETSVNGLVTRAINSSMGKAAECLVFIHDPIKQTVILDAIRKLLADGAPPVRAVIYWRFAYLMRFDEAKAFNLFITAITQENDAKVLASSLWSLQYLVNYDFEQLLPLFKRLILIDEMGQDDRQMLGSIIFICHLKGKTGALELYKEFLDLQSKARSWALHDALEYFYLFKDSPAKCLDTLLFLVLLANDEEVNEDIRFRLYKLENIKFTDILPFLKTYICSKNFRLNEDLVNYLIISSKDRPFDSIDIFSQALKRSANLKDDDMLRDEDHLTQFIIAGFNSLKQNDRKSDRYRNKLLKSFDRILMDHRFRNKAEDILEAL